MTIVLLVTDLFEFCSFISTLICSASSYLIIRPIKVAWLYNCPTAVGSWPGPTHTTTMRISDLQSLLPTLRAHRDMGDIRQELEVAFGFQLDRFDNTRKEKNVDSNPWTATVLFQLFFLPNCSLLTTFPNVCFPTVLSHLFLFKLESKRRGS
jgi:hypothetical protein